MTEVDNYV